MIVYLGAGGFSRSKVGDFLEQHRDRGKEKDRLLFKNVHHKQAALDGKVIVITEDERYVQLVLGSYCDVRPAKEMEIFHVHEMRREDTESYGTIAIAFQHSSLSPSFIHSILSVC